MMTKMTLSMLIGFISSSLLVGYSTSSPVESTAVDDDDSHLLPSSCDGLIEPSVLSIDQSLKNMKGRKGETILLKCSFYSSPQPTIVWYHRGKRIDTHLAPNFESLLTTNQLGQSVVESVHRIDCLDESTAGEYVCEATSPCSPSVMTSSMVTIKKENQLDHPIGSSSSSSLCPSPHSIRQKPISSPPIIADFTISRIELPGGVAQLACRPRGTPQPIITWYRIEEDETMTPIAGQSSYMQLQNGDLLIVSDESTISESFRCRAENPFGVATADASVIYMLP